MNPPSHWRVVSITPGMRAYEHKLIPLRVIRSISMMNNGDKWIHISVTRRNQLPSWDDLTKAKNEFIGPNKEAIQMFPKKEDYVNCHPNCLHIWSPVEVKTTDLPNLQNIRDERAL